MSRWSDERIMSGDKKQSFQLPIQQTFPSRLGQKWKQGRREGETVEALKHLGTTLNSQKQIQEALQYYKEHKFISGFSEISEFCRTSRKSNSTTSPSLPNAYLPWPRNLHIYCQSPSSSVALLRAAKRTKRNGKFHLRTLPDGRGCTHLPFTAAAGLLLPSPTPAHAPHPRPRHPF